MTTERKFDSDDFVVFMDDFIKYTAADWTVTEVGVATQALANTSNGDLLITNAAADNDSSFSQLVGEAFAYSATGRLMYKTRFKVSDATQSDFVSGLQITDTTPLAVTDGIYFRKDDGDALLDFVVIKDSTATTVTGVHTMVDDTYVTLEFHYDGSGTIDYYVDGVLLGSAATTNAPDDEVLTISFGIQNGEAVAKTMTVDYVKAAQDRA